MLCCVINTLKHTIYTHEILRRLLHRQQGHIKIIFNLVKLYLSLGINNFPIIKLSWTLQCSSSFCDVSAMNSCRCCFKLKKTCCFANNKSCTPLITSLVTIGCNGAYRGAIFVATLFDVKPSTFNSLPVLYVGDYVQDLKVGEANVLNLKF